MLTIENISYEIAGRFLYKQANLQIGDKERIGLVGPNGSGKTTLLKMIDGQLKPSEGRVRHPNQYTIGYLRQEIELPETDKSAFSVALEALDEIRELEEQIYQLIEETTVDHDPEKLHKLGDLQERFQTIGGYEAEARVAEILAGLGFDQAKQQQAFATLSGGWRMRVILAQLLLRQPDLLLMDEPTNHLDLPAIEWLEGYLKTFSGSLIIVSHDRYFLDRLCNRIVEVDRARLISWTGNYTKYIRQKAEMKEQQAREYESQQKEIKETEKFINRFRAKASKAKQVQSRVKQLEKINRIEAPDSENPTMNLRFTQTIIPGKNIFDLKLDEKAYGENVVLKNSECHVHRGDHIAIVGPNGIGKSTLLRIVNGMEPFKGERKLGHNVVPALFAQHQLEALNLENTIFEEASTAAKQQNHTEIRSLLGCFLFTGDEIEKPIRVLSGGEKARVALAKTILSGANFLLLDEPTNHLDIQSIEILADALKHFEGTFLIVSHDRWFLHETANKIWFIEDMELKEFPGGFDAFEYHQKQKQSKNRAAEKPKAEEKKETEVPKLSYQEEKERKNLHRKLKRQTEELEHEVIGLEEKKEMLTQQMASPEIAENYTELTKKQEELGRLQKLIDQKTVEWEHAVEELEKMENEAF